jgi:hypothetical protein
MEGKEEHNVKIKIPLPENDPSGGEAEWVWAEHTGSNMFVIRNVPTFAYGISCGDTVKAKTEDGVLVFDAVAERGGHSTYRVYTKSDRKSSEVVQVLQALEKSRCEIEPAMNKVVGIDVLPNANIFEVYRILEQAERAGVLEFDEGHCGHPIHN